MIISAFIAVFSVFFNVNHSFKHVSDVSLIKAYSNNQEYSWVETDSSVALMQDSKVIWKFNHTTPNGKPYFYPLKSSKGHNLVWLRPEDHPWHYGLWFSWKKINEINYWEEDKVTGLSKGKQVVRDVSIKLLEDFSAIVTFDIAYLEETGADILCERRVIEISNPDSEGNYYIDWSFYFKAKSHTVVLDRTPPKKQGGPSYGGYAGLSYRATPHMTDHTYLDSENRVNKVELVGHGKRARWMDLTGTVDKEGSRAGIAMFNHPQNQTKIDVPWYIYKKGPFAFYNAGLLFDHSKEILPHGTLKFNYRVFVHDRTLSHTELETYYKSYIEKTKTIIK